MTIWIYTGDKPSNGAKGLCKTQNFKRLRTGKFVKSKDVVINWGTSKDAPTKQEPLKFLNVTEAVNRAANKFYTFTALAGAELSVVPWTANKAIAQEWQDDGKIVVARTVLTGHSGAGIIIVESEDEIPDAPLYTRYIYKTKEFRVHATPHKVIDTQQKVAIPGQPPKTWKVRSHANGFIFQRQGIAPNQARDLLAQQAVEALGLDFGAVDIIEDKKGNLYVLEVNTAPGLEGQTVDAYVNALLELAHGPKNA